MPTVDELLGDVAVVDKTLVISNDFRTINIPSSIPNLGVEHDDDVLRLDFKMPRYVSDTDLSTFAIRINYMNAQSETDAYTVNDAKLEEDENGTEYITFSWLVGPTATKFKGDTKFIVCVKTVNDEGVIDKEFNTTIASLPVLEGLEVDESIVTEYSDIIEQWRRELFGIGDTEEASIRNVAEAERTAIKNEGAQIIASIPEEMDTWFEEHYDIADGVVYGRSAYEIAREQGFQGTEEEWIASLKGYTPIKGVDYYTDAEQESLTAKVCNDVVEDIINPIITATPETLADIISSAVPNTTVRLLAGEYDVLKLIGQNAYPENLTILGGEGVTVAGISITSGIDESFWDCDNSNAILPKSLTLKDLVVSRGISLRNGVVDNLSIINCHITSGSISIVPNLYEDQFGSEAYNPTNGYRRSNIALPPVRDLLIRDCVIDDASHETIGSLRTAIYVQCADNATIENNTINRAQFNGIQIASLTNGGSTTTGKIAISDNTINYSGSRSIRVSNLRDATLWVTSNKLYNANQTESNDEYIKVSGCKNTSYYWNMHNSSTHHTNNAYDDGIISVGDGISIASDQPYSVTAKQIGAATKDELTEHTNRTDNPHKITPEQIGARPNTWTPTAAEVGAAPAGYGLGTNAVNVAADSITANGYYEKAIDFGNGNGQQSCSIWHNGFGDGKHADQFATVILGPDRGVTFHRIKYNGAWYGWTKVITSANFSYSNGTLTITTI